MHDTCARGASDASPETPQRRTALQPLCIPERIARAAKKAAAVPPPDGIRLDWIAVDALGIDPSYQRRPSARTLRTVAQIVTGFDWRRFGALIVAPEAQGYAVIDGQHRTLAAAALGIPRVPALIVLHAGVSSEAMVFVGVNDVRTGVQNVDKFRAAVTAGDPSAVALDQVLRGLGIETDVPAGGTLGPRQTRAITALQKLAARHGLGTLGTALEILLDAQPEVELSRFNIAAVTGVVALMLDAAEAGTGNAEAALDALARDLPEIDLERVAEEARQMMKLRGGALALHGRDQLARHIAALRREARRAS